ncbi:aminopeptidase C [uncultured Duncaniella sp.]|jgi:bleomycin hydrolase|uniref:aminopeptidase C n=1 Tax=uncultured Duncaniella sp. TaxID=2768039 RepID=UPI002674C54A|nr:C1 family peptidase [uncultured Duncaniella sp.]MCI9172605.1 aminopeptidase [Muribaculaceae bacterium]
MKKYLSAILMATISLGAFADGKPAKKDKKEPQGYQFTDVKVNKTTPVKDQNKSGTCWSFSGISFLEDELLRITGKEYDLSEMWVVRHCYNDKADKYVRMEGKINFAQGGGTTDVGYVYDRYGMVPESAYRGLEYGEEKHDHYEMEPALRGIVDAVNNKKGKKSTAWKKAFNGVLDAYLGKLPETFEYEGKTYTPQSFAKMLNLNMADYIPVTSYTHHPFYTTFPLEIADNWLWEDSYNVPLEEMKAIVDNALDNGYSIAWGADVSEPGFKWTDGYAVLPKKKTEADLSGTELARWVTLSDKERENENNDVSKPREEIVVTQDLRQEMFDNHETTDDHGMVIMGKAVDQNGTRYYKVKNSWDTNQKYGGFFYVSEPYFMGKTMSILVHRDAIPAEIAAKMNLPKK